MQKNGFTLIEVLISLSLLGLIITCGFATQREYQVLQLQAQHFQEQQAQFVQLREIIESYASIARNQACPRCDIEQRGGIAISQWRNNLPKYMQATLTATGNNQLTIKLCSALPTKCIDEKIVV